MAVNQPFKTKRTIEKKHKVYQLQLTNINKEDLSYDVFNNNIGDFNINYPTALSSDEILDLVWHACNVKEWNDNYKINEDCRKPIESIFLEDITFNPAIGFTGIANSDIYVVIDMDSYKDIYVAKSSGWVRVKTEDEAIKYILHNYPGIKWDHIRNKDEYNIIYNGFKSKDLKIGDYVSYKGFLYQIESLNYIHCCLLKDLSSISGREISAYYEDLMPIRLTNEILEKNGWTAGCNIHNYYLNDLSVFLYTFDNMIDSELYTEPDYYPVEKISSKKIKYVHQLQHILWALGIDDNVKL